LLRGLAAIIQRDEKQDLGETTIWAISVEPRIGRESCKGEMCEKWWGEKGLFRELKLHSNWKGFILKV
jgi:hypothetical protein